MPPIFGANGAGFSPEISRRRRGTKFRGYRATQEAAPVEFWTFVRLGMLRRSKISVYAGLEGYLTFAATKSPIVSSMLSSMSFWVLALAVSWLLETCNEWSPPSTT
jgi:hypothetical protein